MCTPMLDTLLVMDQGPQQHQSRLVVAPQREQKKARRREKPSSVSSGESAEAALHAACCTGDKACVSALLEVGADLNDASEEDGQTPLMEAAARGHAHVALVLLAHGTDILAFLDSMRGDHSSPLYCVAQSGFIDTITLRDELCARVNQTDYSGRSALWIASRNGKLPVVEACLDHGADVNLASESGRSPLFIAARLGHLAVVKALLARGADANLRTKFGAAPLDAACQVPGERAVDLATHLIDAGSADVDFAGTGCTALYAACQAGHVNLAKLLVARGADVNKPAKNGFTCLEVAVRARVDDDDTVEFRRLLIESLLLEHGARLC
mmetsp:Transcript_1042/g.3059  ORF Transcript_1042/g.3059 Transcript_1042/m.3059 type:complete len:326 (-) Transcript_1042:210-1187(-)